MPVSIQPDKPIAGEIAKMQPGIRQRLRAQYRSLRNLHPEKQHPKRIACPVIRQDVPVSQIGIRKTGAVKPRVTSITDLEDDRDQNLQEWEGSVPENDGNDDDRRKRKVFSECL